MSELFTGSNLAAALIMGGVLVLVVVLGIVLLSGRGASLIAGYNTMSKKEKARWNERALTKAAGIYLLGTGGWLVGLFFATVLDIGWLALALSIAFIAGTAFLLLFTNKSKRFKR